MEDEELAGLSVGEIINRWPATIEVFLRLRMHCVGCPVNGFNRLAEAAAEHKLALDLLTANIFAAIEAPAPKADRAPPRPR